MKLYFYSTAISLAMVALCAVPTHGQIVSYRDDSGRRIFINANPVPLGGKPQVTKAVLNRGNVFQTTRGQASASVTNEVATQVNRERIAEMVREVSKRYSVDPI